MAQGLLALIKGEDMSGMKKGAGFTLIELLVVAALVAMLASVGFLYYKRYEWSAITGTAATQLATHLMVARTAAAKSGTDYLFTFYPTSQQYRICKANPSGGCASLPRFYTLPKGIKFGKLSSVSHVPDLGCTSQPSSTCGVVISCNAYCDDGRSFLFKMDGTVSLASGPAASGVVLYLVPSKSDVSKPENQRAVSVGMLSGQVRIWKYYPAGYWK